ncbi:capZ-interacting protein-like isoform X2 [Denticeps clupeoides]|uniref:capZ-interacting protein-like isoform X2 n=1 Tax=Denticeps clupeoides TaxID=299321 RepID=UPI0010A3E8C7|nr:capZ-interacting protein isoform X2 [Denticeps clupeoides]
MNSRSPGFLLLVRGAFTRDLHLSRAAQANLALSPTVAPPTSGSFLSPPLSPTQKPSVDEVPVSFEKPVEGTPLLSINKCRARLSFKRRPPTRQHRKSGSDEPGSPSEQNGGRNDVFDGDAPPASTVKESSQEGQGEEREAENPEAKPPRPDAAHGEDVSEDKPATEEAGRPTEDTATDVQQGHPPGADGATEGKGEETTPPPEEEEETKEKLSAGQ